MFIFYFISNTNYMNIFSSNDSEMLEYFFYEVFILLEELNHIQKINNEQDNQLDKNTLNLVLELIKMQRKILYSIKSMSKRKKVDLNYTNSSISITSFFNIKNAFENDDIIDFLKNSLTLSLFNIKQQQKNLSPLYNNLNKLINKYTMYLENNIILLL